MMRICSTPKCDNEATNRHRLGDYCIQCMYRFNLVGQGAAEKKGMYGTKSEDDKVRQLEMFNRSPREKLADLKQAFLDSLHQIVEDGE